MIMINGKYAHDFLATPFTANAEELFDSPYTTTELRYELEITIHPVRDAARHAELNDSAADWFFRSAIVSALDELGVTVSTINRRRW